MILALALRADRFALASPTFAAGRNGVFDYLGRSCGRLLASETRLAQDRKELERHGLKGIGRARRLAFALDRRIDPTGEIP
ncbi:MAG: hypothetical protein ACREE2_21785, partial [Stellaceae bacterium]